MLIALADLAVAHGQDNGDPLSLDLSWIAERFIDLYWQQAALYKAPHGPATPGILRQNAGAQAAVLNALVEFRARTGAKSHRQARRSGADYAALLKAVRHTVAKMPLKYLQNFGGTTDAFLYEPASRSAITLNPGVAYCLRRFYPLIQQLSRLHWVAHIKGNQLNLPILGEATDLEDFLFSASRQSQVLMGEGLRKLGGDHCFYCGDRLNQADVDHFIPFSPYPRDLAQNFVLAHPACNRSKSDSLAGQMHLERWVERNARHRDGLAEVAEQAGITADGSLTHSMANWAYRSAHVASAHAWVKPREYEPIGVAHLAALAVLAS